MRTAIKVLCARMIQGRRSRVAAILTSERDALLPAFA
jgi:hypothetical protein